MADTSQGSPQHTVMACEKIDLDSLTLSAELKAYWAAKKSKK